MVRNGPCWLSALLVLAAGCGLFTGKKDEPAPRPAPEPKPGSVWDQRLEGTGPGAHSARIGAASIETLALGGPATAPKVADHLTDPNPDVRDKAVEVLAGWGSRAAPGVPRVLYHLRNVDPAIRTSAAEALARMGVASSANGLERACEDSDARVRAWAHAGLARIEGDCQEHMESVAGLLASGAAPDDAAAAMARMSCVNQDVVEVLVRALAKDDDDIRVAAAHAIGRIGPKAAAAVPALMAALGDEKNFRLRQAALVALARMGPKAATAVPMLTQVLEDRAPRFRELAAIALGAVGSAARQAIGPLKKLTTDPDGRVQAAAKRALGLILSEPGAARPGKGE